MITARLVLKRTLVGCMAAMLATMCGCEDVPVAEIDAPPPIPEPKVSVFEQDLDKDGEPEIVVQSDYLTLVILKPAASSEEKFGRRFVWGGWITDLIFRPTGTNFLVGGTEPDVKLNWDRKPCGLPDQFEKRLVVETNGDERKEILVGVGVVRAERRESGRWAVASLVRAPEWEYGVSILRGGRRVLTFEQKLREGRWGYRLAKRLIFTEKSSAFRMELTLENTGENVIDTDWYLHPFFSFAGHGTAWQTIPYRVPIKFGDEDRPMVLRQAAALPVMDRPGVVWGWLTSHRGDSKHGELGGERWCATGAWGKDVFMGMSWDFHWDSGPRPGDQFLRLRNWLNSDVYALEPFTDIELQPGEVRSWHVDVTAGSGMSGASRVSRRGALHVEPFGGGLNAVQVTFAPSRPMDEIEVRFAWKQPAAKEPQSVSRSLGSAAPDQPVSTVFDLGDAELPISATTWIMRKGKLLEASSDHILPEERRFDTSPPTARPGGPVLVVTTETDKGREAAYVRGCVRWAGLRAESCSVAQMPADLRRYSAVLAVTPDPVPGEAGARLAEYVRAGGGLVACAPQGLADSPAAAVLPVVFERRDGKPIAPFIDVFSWTPALSGDPDAENVWQVRAHLRPTQPHPITSRLPWWPGSYQSIARLCLVRAKPEALPLLTYALPPKLSSWPGVEQGSPALVVWQAGRGRVAAFMSPVYWGNPPHWVLWGRFAECHRQLITRMLLWAGGELPAR